MQAGSRDRVDRRLAAILAADVVGYSRLMEADEAGTARLLREHRTAADPFVTEHGGRIVKTTGDGVLIEFSSVVGAVQCAVAIQNLMTERNAGVPSERRMDWRIGIHLGDILIDGEDILGDGVNLAARLEGIAEPGGICISEDAFRQVRGKIEAEFLDGGEQALKNIARPVRVYRTQPVSVPVAAVSATFAPPLALPDKPSIAVLPFQNMSGDPEQEYFADGVVEDITAALCRIRDFFVIARNSAFTYKGRAIPIQQVSRELGVRYLIEGSVRRAADRVRLTAQLIDGSSGNHLWADRYEGPITDIFDLQDRITESVVGAIQPSVRSAEIERSRRKRPESLDAYDLVLRAYPSVWSLERTANTDALNLLNQAIAIESSYALALSLAAWCLAQQVVYNWAAEPEKTRAEALRLAQKAASGGGEDPTILTVLSAAHTIVRSFAAAGRLLEKALTLDPNSAWAWNRSGWLHAYLDDPDLSIEHFERALRLSPYDPLNFNAFMGLGAAHFAAGRYADAVLWFERGLVEHPGATWVYRNLASAYALAGREADARTTIKRLLEDYPGITISKVLEALVFSPSTLDRLAKGLRLAGLQE
jgi:adenylate cyclase